MTATEGVQPGPVRPLFGAVLAGGRARRFGRDKTAVPVEGVPMIERAVAALREVCDDVVVVSSRGDTPVGAWRIVPDARPDRGPLGGIETALEEADREGFRSVLVLAADLPLVEVSTLRSVVDALADSDAAAARRAGEPDFEPLCAAYRRGCLAHARGLLDRGHAAAHALFEEVGGVRVAVNDDVTLNVNTPEDLARAEAILERRRGRRAVESDRRGRDRGAP